MSERFRVLHIISTLDPGGAQRQVVNLANNLDRSVFDISLCCTNGAGLLAAELHPDVSLTVFEKRSGLDNLPIALRMFWMIRRQRFHVVHTHLFSPGLWGRMAAWAAGTPVIVATEHGITPSKAKPYVWADRVLARITDAVTAVATAVADMRLRREHVPPGKLLVIPNSIDLETYGRSVSESALDALRQQVGLSPGDRAVGVVARLTPIKGLSHFLEAASLVLARMDNVVFILVGDGPLRPSLEKQAADLGIQRQVRFLGSRTDVPLLLQVLDVAVLTSLSEACPLALLEYMAAGRAIVATRVGGVPEILDDGKTGYLVPAADPVALAERIRALLQDGAEKQRLATNARDRAQAFAAERIACLYASLYLRLLDEKRTG